MSTTSNMCLALRSHTCDTAAQRRIRQTLVSHSHPESVNLQCRLPHMCASRMSEHAVSQRHPAPLSSQPSCVSPWHSRALPLELLCLTPPQHMLCASCKHTLHTASQTTLHSSTHTHIHRQRPTHKVHVAQLLVHDRDDLRVGQPPDLLIDIVLHRHHVHLTLQDHLQTAHTAHTPHTPHMTRSRRRQHTAHSTHQQARGQP